LIGQFGDWSAIESSFLLPFLFRFLKHTSLSRRQGGRKRRGKKKKKEKKKKEKEIPSDDSKQSLLAVGISRERYHTAGCREGSGGWSKAGQLMT
jgi:hypothetical protein